jgi:hypothetical protein
MGVHSARFLLGLSILALLLFGGAQPSGSLSAWTQMGQTPSLNLPSRAANAFSCNGVTEIPASECEALVAFYHSTNGLGWTNNTNWLASNTPSNWYGVTVSDGHVHGLQMLTNNVQGVLPAQLGDLSDLSYLALLRNNLTGPLPVALGGLVHLTVLSLGGNQLSGPIPPELGNLQNLERLNMPLNRLSGGIPPELGNLARLTYLDLSGNLLHGRIPVELGSLAHVQEVYLAACALEGPIPPELAELTQLTRLVVSYNMLWAEDPDVLAFMNATSPDWESTQTVAPTGLQAIELSLPTAQLSWSPIPYRGDGGYYEIAYATESGRPYTVHGNTEDKNASQYTVTGLERAAPYYLVVRSHTPAHGNQPNDLYSRYSAEIVVHAESYVTLKGHVWLDRNGDGKCQTNEGLAGVLVTLDPEAMVATGLAASVTRTTDEAGYYRFDAVAAGLHHLRFSDPQQRLETMTVQVVVPQGATAPTELDLDLTWRVRLPVVLRMT